MAEKPLPSPTESPQAIKDKLNAVALQDPDRVVEWLKQNTGKMDAATFQDVASYFYQTGGRNGRVVLEQSGELYDRYRAGEGGNWSEVADQRLVDEQSGSRVSWDLDEDGRVDASEEKMRADAESRMAKADAERRGVPQEVAQSEIDQRAGVLDGMLTPDPLKAVIGNRVPSPQEIDRIITTWNYLNPDDRINPGDQADLYRKLSVATPDVKNVLDATFYGIDPVQEYSVMLADGRKVIVDANEFSAFQSLYSLQSHEMSTLIRSAGRLGIVNHAGDVAFQMLAPLVVAARSQGGNNPFPSLTEIDQKTPAVPDVLPGSPVGQGAQQMQSQQQSMAARLDQLGLKFKEGQYIYAGNDFLAYIHALNPTLATKISGDPKAIKPEDAYAAQQLMIDGRFSPEQLAKMGYFATGLAEWQQEKGYGSGGSGSGPTRMIADQDALRQAATDMYRAMFAQDPTDKDVKALMDAANGAVASAAPNESVDVQAKIRAQLEQNPLFKELYGNRPGGMNPDEYQNQFRQGAAALLGNEAADPTAIQSGMRTGDYQTTLGQVAGSKKAWGNSTFLGRLAEAARLVSENT